MASQLQNLQGEEWSKNIKTYKKSEVIHSTGLAHLVQDKFHYQTILIDISSYAAQFIPSF